MEALILALILVYPAFQLRKFSMVPVRTHRKLARRAGTSSYERTNVPEDRC